MKRAAIYIRVSHHSQVEGKSLQDQERMCRELAQREGYKVTRVYCDAGKSAYKDDLAARPNFAKMLIDASGRAFNAVIVYKLDRFARKARIYHNEVYRLECAGVRLLSASEPADNSASGRLSSGMMAQFAEFYSAQLSERIRLVLASKIRRGEWIGDVPFGYARAGRSLQPGPLALWVVIIFQAYMAGYRSTKIAHALNEAGVPLRSGKRWTRDSVLMVLNNRAYIGYGRCKSVGEYESKHQPLITEAIWLAAQKRRVARGGVGKRKARRGPEPWRVLCEKCGKPMHLGVSGSTKNRRTYYRCSAAIDGECLAKGVRAELVKAQIQGLIAAGNEVGAAWVAAPRGVSRFEKGC